MKRMILLLLAVFLVASACDNGTAPNTDGPGDETGGDVTPPDPAPTLTFFADADGDGFGDPASGVEAESAPEGFVDNNEDCNDGSASIHPGAKDPAHDGIDQDCDGFFQWLPAEAESDGFLLTWAVDATAQVGDNEIRAGDLSGLLLFGRSVHYDTFGRITRIETLSDRLPGITQFLDYTYDGAGHVVETTGGLYTDPAAPTIQRVNRFLYDGGLKVSLKNYNGDPASVPVQSSDRWEYDAEGRVSRFEHFSGDFEDGGTLLSSNDYTYDANGFLNGLFRKDGTGAIEFVSVLTNDEEGRPLTYKRFSEDPADPSATVSLSCLLDYDGQGHLILYTTFRGDFDDPAAEVGRMYFMTYDGDGNRVGLRYFDFFVSSNPRAVVAWTYDEHGNFLSIELPLDERPTLPVELLDTDDPSRPEEPAVPTGPATASDYFLAPFDIVPVEGAPGLL